MPEKVRAGSWTSVPDMLVACARHRPDVPLLVESDGSSVTAARLLEHASRGAEALHRRGVGPGSPVAIDTGRLSWREVATAYFSVVWLGAVAVLIQDELTEQVARQTVDLSALITVDGQRSDLPAVLALAQLLAVPRHDRPPVAGPDDQLDLVFTSGTTGRPKPVASTHAQWTGAVRPELMTSRVRRVVGHTGVPIGVSGGLHGILLNHVARGVTSLCGHTPADLLAACRDRDVYELHLTPHAARAMARLTGGTEPWALGVRMIRVVGGPLPATVAEQLSGRFPRARVVSLYGLTEGGPALCVRVVGHTDRDSIGRPMPGTEVRVRDAAGRDLPAGEVGELAVRADGTLGWVRTGDLGYVAGTGEVRLVGRARELIFLRGGRVSPEAVEEILSRHIPAGVEYAVAGVTTAGTWDRIAVFLGGGAGGDLLDQAQRRLTAMTGPFRPQVVKVVAALPRGPFGKPLRRRLLQELGAGSGPAPD